MTYEFEFRKIQYFATFEEALSPIQHLPYRQFPIYYIESYRIKPEAVEIKNVLSKEAVFFDGIWFRYVESFELPYKKWNRKQHKRFVHLLGLDQKNFIIEHRYEVKLSNVAKLYAFEQKFNKFGLAFELESQDLNDLYPFRCFYRQFFNNNDNNNNFNLHKLTLQRKPVQHLHTLKNHQYLKAIKHDGVYGFIFSTKHSFYEKWEDNVFNSFSFLNNYPGLVFAAERMPNNTVILLDVLYVNNVPVYRKDVRHVLLNFLPSLTHLPSHYKVQVYYFADETIPSSSSLTDGLIYHTYDDCIYKYKPTKTVELFYENGFLKSFTAAFPCSLPLKNGSVYECRLNPLQVLKERKDRFLCNTDLQIKNIFGNSDTCESK